jgi:hypothetical protein
VGSINIPASLTSIGAGAFAKCKFTTIDLDETNPAFAFATNVGSTAKVLVAKSGSTAVIQ